MRKLITILMALSLTFLVACSSEPKQEATDVNSQPQDVEEVKTDAPVESVLRSEELGEPLASYSTDMLTLDFYKTVENKEYYAADVFTDIVYVNAIITNNSAQDVLVDGIVGWEVEEKIIRAGAKKQVTVDKYCADGNEKPGDDEMTHGYALHITSPDSEHTYERVRYTYSYDENLVVTGFANFKVDEWGMPTAPEEDENETKGGLAVLIGENENAKVVLTSVERSKGLDAEAFGIDGYRYDYVLEVTNKTGKELNMNGTVLPAGATITVTGTFEGLDDTFKKDEIYVLVSITDPSDIIQTGKGTGPNGEDEFEEATVLHAEEILNYNEL